MLPFERCARHGVPPGFVAAGEAARLACCSPPRAQLQQLLGAQRVQYPSMTALPGQSGRLGLQTASFDMPLQQQHRKAITSAAAGGCEHTEGMLLYTSSCRMRQCTCCACSHGHADQRSPAVCGRRALPLPTGLMLARKTTAGVCAPAQHGLGRDTMSTRYHCGQHGESLV